MADHTINIEMLAERCEYDVNDRFTNVSNHSRWGKTRFGLILGIRKELEQLGRLNITKGVVCVLG